MAQAATRHAAHHTVVDGLPGQHSVGIREVNNAIRGKLLECETLIEQAVNNSKEQFNTSPDLDARILDAVMDALASFTHMSKQALESERIRAEIKAILMGPGRLYEALRDRASAQD